jgi:hypothetical protein
VRCFIYLCVKVRHNWFSGLVVNTEQTDKVTFMSFHKYVTSIHILHCINFACSCANMIVFFDGRFVAVFGIYAYCARGHRFHSRTIQNIHEYVFVYFFIWNFKFLFRYMICIHLLICVGFDLIGYQIRCICIIKVTLRHRLIPTHQKVQNSFIRKITAE